MGSVGIVNLQNRDAAQIFRGHELTSKHRRLSSGLTALDAILDGGVVRGRISEIVGPIGSGRTSIAARFISAATLAGEVAAWIESARNFDPADIAAGSASLDRILWASVVDDRRTLALDSSERFRRYRFSSVFKAAEMVLKAGGFGLVVIDIGPHAAPLPQSIALRLAREAERSGAAVIVVAPYRICGTFAALSLKLTRLEASFNRIAPASPALFDGVVIQASTVRNKLGRTGGSAVICGAIDPLAPSFAREDNRPAFRPVPIRNASNA
ncbi:MAG TPA: hypothetical protein VJX23_14295 [Candidatus Binataceae bacterium]|nr:hypothetical protein [Candidatus Binataceae bacterium]